MYSDVRPAYVGLLFTAGLNERSDCISSSQTDRQLQPASARTHEPHPPPQLIPTPPCRHQPPQQAPASPAHVALSPWRSALAPPPPSPLPLLAMSQHCCRRWVTRLPQESRWQQPAKGSMARTNRRSLIQDAVCVGILFQVCVPSLSWQMVVSSQENGARRRRTLRCRT